MSSVLEKLRTGSDSTIMQVVFAAVVISFVGWGVGNKGGSQTDTVATVNGEAITGIDFAREYRAEEQRASQRSQGGLTDDMRAELREKVTESLIRKHALAQEARRLGLEVSAAEIAQSLLGKLGGPEALSKFGLENLTNIFAQRQAQMMGPSLFA